MANKTATGRLILHIGMHKTGSTAIQGALSKHRDVLAEYAIDYLDFNANHSRTVAGLFSHSARGIYRGFADEEDRLARGFEQLERLLGDRSHETTVISGERFSMLKPDEVRVALDWLGRFFDDIRVVAFVRPPRSFLNSMAQQRLKIGRTLSETVSNPPSPAYRSRFGAYMEYLPAERLAFIPFDSAHLVEGCSVRTLLEWMGLPGEAVDRIPVDRRNESFSATGVRVFNELNRRGIDLSDSVRRNRIYRLLREIDGPKFVLPATVIDACTAPFDEDVAWMNGILGEDIRAHDLAGSAEPGIEVFDLTEEDRMLVETVLAKIERIGV